MALYVFGILIVLSLVNNSIQDTRCYDCMEYVNKYEDQAGKQQTFNVTIGTRRLERLCHNLDDVSRPELIRTCTGSSCVKAVVKLNEYVDAVYRTCASELDCNTFTSPIPGGTTKFCETCKGDECNSSTSITASLFLIFLTVVASLRNF